MCGGGGERDAAINQANNDYNNSYKPADTSNWDASLSNDYQNQYQYRQQQEEAARQQQESWQQQNDQNNNS